MTEEKVCPYCKSICSEPGLYATDDIAGNQYWLYPCDVCKAVFLHPSPDEEQLAAAYNESYYGRGQAKFGRCIEAVLDHFRMRRASLVTRYVPRGGNLLDIGCGNGKFLEFARRLADFHLYGIERPGNAAQRAACVGGLQLRTGNLADQDYPEAFFDAVTLFHVFEHLQDPRRVLTITARILKRGGICLMSFPNIDSCQAHLFEGRWFHLDPPRHLFYFKPRDFAAVAAAHGFAVERVSFMNLEYAPYGIAQSVLNLVGSRKDVLYEFMRHNRAYVRRVSRSELLAQGIFVACTFPLFVLLAMIEGLCGRGGSVEFVLRKR